MTGRRQKGVGAWAGVHLGEGGGGAGRGPTQRHTPACQPQHSALAACAGRPPLLAAGGGARYRGKGEQSSSNSQSWKRVWAPRLGAGPNGAIVWPT